MKESLSLQIKFYSYGRNNTYKNPKQRIHQTFESCKRSKTGTFEKDHFESHGRLETRTWRIPQIRRCMVTINLDRINQVSPYLVEVADRATSFMFKTDNGSLYDISFEESLAFESINNVYEISFFRIGTAKHVPDSKVKDTLFAVVYEFFSTDSNILLYICASNDHKQAARNRLFTHWYESSNLTDKFSLYNIDGIDEDGNSIYASLLSRKDNPNIKAALGEFMQYKDISKPSC